MGTASEKPFWEEQNKGFAICKPEDDYLHRPPGAEAIGESLTETQFFGFNIPEERIHGLGYIWYHPNLNTVMCAAWAWQGVKRHNFQCEIFDMMAYTSDVCLENDLRSYACSNGYSVETLEPLKRHRIRYEDADRGNGFDISYEAVMPPVMLETGLHFEQGMRTHGELTLRGKTYPVNGYTIRDRTWGQARPERNFDTPPLDWMTCAFGDDFLFGCTAFDSMSMGPDWAGLIHLPDEHMLRGGWIRRDGETFPVVSARKLTIRNPQTLHPVSVQLDMTDSTGREYHVTGHILASANWRAWYNVESVICLCEWECEGRIGHGDFQEFQWSKYVGLLMPT